MFATRLEEAISQIFCPFPHLIGKGGEECHLRDKLFYGMVECLWDNVYYMYNNSTINYIQLKVTACKAETEVVNSRGTATTSKAAAVKGTP